jgi:Cu/Ag efflux pump CusA
MMTTMAALLGAISIALGRRIGGEARRPLGLAVIGGLIISQSLTLYLTPTLYLCLRRFQKKKCDERQNESSLLDLAHDRATVGSR